MTYPLTLIYNKALSEGSTPLAWKQSHITPLFKKGSRLDAANYRPVSITSVPCEVMEKIIKEQITKYLEKTSCISNNQHGFMSKKGCTSNLLESIDYITKALSKRNFVDIAFLDFAKSFDKVSHRRLIHKLKAYGINGNVGKWIESFLTSRKQRTVLEIKPEFHDADCLILQNDLNIISEWSKEWPMELNVAKCKVVHFGHGNINHEYVMNDGNTFLIIAATDVERDLGIFLSNDLKWNQHIEVATRRANMILGLLKKTFRSRDIKLWGKLYTTYVRPHLEFAVPVWCRRLNFTSLETRRRRGDLIQQFKLENGFEIINWHNRRTPSNVLTRDSTYNNARHNFFRIRIVNDWNYLPLSCKKTPSINPFKSRIDKYFFPTAANSASFTEDELHV
nr:uncharacterized protein LOC105845176 [Hydra vulgaris]